MKLAALAGFLAASFLVAGVSTLFTIPAIPTWYTTLAKPSFNPPNAIFSPVWTTLYTLMAIAAWLVWKLPPSPLRSRALLLYGAELALNFAWSLIFFRLRKSAGWLFVPCLAWVTFAGVLNFAIWRLN